MNLMRALALIIFVGAMALLFPLLTRLAVERQAAAPLPRLPGATVLSTATAPSSPTAAPVAAMPTAYGAVLKPPAPITALPAAPSLPSATAEPVRPTREPASATPAPATAAPPASSTPAPVSVTPTPSATAPPVAATPVGRARVIGNTVDPPWWPCVQGAVKGVIKIGSYYQPDHPAYNRMYVGVTCFSDVAAAQAAGLREAAR